LLKARDAFIARRIAETLQEGETGVIFLGALHQLQMPAESGLTQRPLFA
jgi:hypothetical protein